MEAATRTAAVVGGKAEELGISSVDDAEEIALASGPVIRHVLLQGFQLSTQIIHPPLEKISNGEDAEQFAVVIGDGKMAEMTLQHDTQSFARSGLLGCHFDGSGHQLADGRGLRIQASQRHFAEDVALGEHAGHAEVAVNHGDGAHVMVEHFVDGVGHRGFQAYGCNLTVAKLENAHKHLHPASGGEAGSIDRK